MNQNNTDTQIKRLWLGLENITFDKHDRITDNYSVWRKGTHISDIWSWFSKNYSGGLKQLWEDTTFIY